MKPISKDDAALLRSCLRNRIKHLESHRLKSVIDSAFEAALADYNSEARALAARRCDWCKVPSVRGEYRNGRRIWICCACLAKED